MLALVLIAVVPDDPSKTISTIEVFMAYYYNVNTAYYDDISLTMEPTQSYSYDTEGNLVSAREPNGKTAYEYYTDTKLLKSYTDLSGVKYSMTYEDTTHNLLTAASDGVTVTNTYDSAGNHRTADTSAGGTSLFLRSWSQYSNGGNTLYITESVNGMGYRYSYDTARWQVSSSYQAGGPTQRYSYCDNSTRLNQTYISGETALLYHYGDGILSALDRKSYTDGTAVWQRYGLAHDAFGNSTGITVKRSADGSGWSGGRTLASYTYSLKSAQRFLPHQNPPFTHSNKRVRCRFLFCNAPFGISWMDTQLTNPYSR